MINDSVLLELNRALARRTIDKGLALLRSQLNAEPTLDQSQRNVAPFVGQLARWADIDFALLDVVDNLLSTSFPSASRATLTYQDAINLRLAEGVLEMHRGGTMRAIAHLGFALSGAVDVGDSDLAISVNYYLGRCNRMLGRYDVALEHTRAAKEFANQLPEHENQVAVIEILEAWLYFQQGKPGRALELLDSAELRLEGTDDFISKGNIFSFRARIARHRGRDATKHFDNAIAQYEKRKHQATSPNLGRALANRALVNVARLSSVEKRLTAAKREEETLHKRQGTYEHVDKHLIQIRAKFTDSKSRTLIDEIDRMLWQLHDADVCAESRANQFLGTASAEIEELRKNALIDLDRAKKVYEHLRHNRGLGMCHLRYAYLYLETCRLDLAEQEAEHAHALGQGIGDPLLCGRARVLQCQILDRKVAVNGEIRNDRQARTLFNYAKEALEWARNTQNLGLRASAYITMGFAYLNPPFHDPEITNKFSKRAAETIKMGHLFHLGENLQALRIRLAKAGRADSPLEEWLLNPQGKSLEELVDIIYRVSFEHEGGRTTRVAKSLDVRHDTLLRRLRRLALHA